MGYADIPNEIKPGRNQIVMELDREELSQVIGVLQGVLKRLTVPNMPPEQSLAIVSPSQSANGWLPLSSPRSQTVHPLPQARAFSSSLFSAPFPLSNELTSPAYSDRGTSAPVQPPGINVSSPAVAALQQRIGRDGGIDLGLSASSEWEGLSSLTTPGYPAPAQSRPGEIRHAKQVAPIAPPQPLGFATSSSIQQSTSTQSWPATILPKVGGASGQAQSQSRLELGHVQGSRAQAGSALASASPNRKPVGLQVSSGNSAATVLSLQKAPGSAHVLSGPQGIVEIQRRPHETGHARGLSGHQAALRPVKQEPVQSPGGSNLSWTTNGDRGLGLAEQLRKTHLSEVSEDTRTGIVSNQIANLPGKIDKITIGQRGGSHMRAPGPIPLNNGAFAPRGPIGHHARMQGPHGQMLRPGVAGPSETPEYPSPMFVDLEPRFSKGGLVRVPIEASLWRGRWTTAAAEHNRDNVTALNYSYSFDGLSERDSHSGWLISSSKNLLNLWECISQKKPAESPLQLSHSQATEFILESMDIDLVSNVLISIGPNTREAGFCIPVHSLRGESFFSYSGMIRVPENPGISALRKQGTCPGYLHAVSLSSAGGPLRTSVAAAVGVDVLIYDLAAVTTSPLPSTPPPAPKAYWRAHDSPISAMHRSSFNCTLITGAADGTIRLWDMKTKPTVPVRQCMQQKQITGLSVLDEVTLSSCSVDGAVHLWDVRQTNVAFLSINPDGKAVVNMGANSSGETVALTTRKGLYCWELSEVPGASSLLSPFTPLPPAGPCTDLKWNGDSKLEVYVSSVDGTISVFTKI